MSSEDNVKHLYSIEIDLVKQREKRMHHLFRPLRKLRWQLSLSYILVVVVAIPILLGAGLALLTLSPSLPPAQQLARQLAREVAPQVPRQSNGQIMVERAQLNAWAVNFIQGQLPVKPGSYQNVPQLNATETLAVVIIDHLGRLVGSGPILPSKNAALDPSSLTFFLQKMQINIPESQQVIKAAFANAPNLADLVSTQVDGQTLAAVPLLDNQQSVRGVLFVDVRGLRDDPQASTGPLGDLFARQQGGEAQFTALLPYALLLILVVSVIGTIFGVIVAGRITRRLQRISSAAHAWSVGDFKAHVSDRSIDELGQLARDLNRMAQKVQHLLDTQQQLASLEERQRVARDLHDSVKQQAFALTLLIGAAQSLLPDSLESARESLSKAEKLANQIRQELTAILQQLRPVALVGKGLQTALRDYIRQWSQQAGIACDFQASGSPEVLALHPEIEEAFFRMAQEALANAARHSQASQVRVQLEQGVEEVCLRVFDNGKGFAVEQAMGGHGLTNMRDRMEAYGGTLHISGASGETVATGCIPFPGETHLRRHKRKREHI